MISYFRDPTSLVTESKNFDQKHPFISNSPLIFWVGDNTRWARLRKTFLLYEVKIRFSEILTDGSFTLLIYQQTDMSLPKISTCLFPFLFIFYMDKMYIYSRSIVGWILRNDWCVCKMTISLMSLRFWWKYYLPLPLNKLHKSSKSLPVSFSKFQYFKNDRQFRKHT